MPWRSVTNLVFCNATKGQCWVACHPFDSGSAVKCLEKILACLCGCRSIVCASRLYKLGFYKHAVKQSDSTATEIMTSYDFNLSMLTLPDGPRLSLASLSPSAIMQQLTSRPLTEVVRTSA